MSKQKSQKNSKLVSAEETVPSDNCGRFIARADELLSQGLDISEVNLILEEEFKTEKLEPISTGPALADAEKIAEAAIQQHEMVAAKLDENEDLSGVGRQKELDKTSVELLGELDAATKAIDTGRAEHQEIQSNLAELAKVDATAAETALYIERRAALSKLNAEQKLETIAQARLSGDIDTLRAIVQVPHYVLGVPEATWSSCRDKLVELTGTGEQQRATELGRHIEQAQKSVDQARDSIRSRTSRDGLKASGEHLFADEMTDDQKAGFIKTHGLQAWRKVVSRTYKRT